MGFLSNNMRAGAAAAGGSSYTPTTKGIFAFGAIGGGTNTAISIALPAVLNVGI